MKKNKIIYWIVTILFVAFMIFTAIPEVLNTAESIAFMDHLGYPPYFNPFIGIAKFLGCIAILIPGFPRVKEWAYAGLAFDLTGAIYSMIAVDGFQVPMLFMLVPVVLGVFSYVYYHKLLVPKTNSG
jgi:uncharacterized membrane protein YphA (DoxX/SURF4 family)